MEKENEEDKVEVFEMEFDTPVKSIKIISQDKYVEHFKKRGLGVPPFLCFQPYFEIDGKGYYLISG